MNYNTVYEGEDFTVISISDIKETKHGTYYREIVFDKHPNPDYRNKQIPSPKVREFHKYEDEFIDISIGQVLHDVKIYAKMIGINKPGKYYSLEAFDDYIVGKGH